ncbi:phosphotransferase [Patescibacteria group bacterium]|nr:phosphotransferase [Patescibacteria group bacterium]
MNALDKWCFNYEFHKKLEEVVAREYGIKPTFSDLISWGYTTNAYFIETKNKTKRYVARLTKYSPAKIKETERDLFMTKYLADSIPIPKLFENKRGELITFIKKETDKQGVLLMENAMMRLSEYIEAVPPFDMTDDIYKQVLVMLKKVHSHTIPDYEFSVINEPKVGKKEYKLLHGDLTPSNVLVAHGKVIVIGDFDESCIGPVEWDLAKTLVFSWFRMKERKFTDVFELTKEVYRENLLPDLILEYSKNHIEYRLDNINRHKTSYEKPHEWEADYNFTNSKLEELPRNL